MGKLLAVLNGGFAFAYFLCYYFDTRWGKRLSFLTAASLVAFCMSEEIKQAYKWLTTLNMF